MSPLGVREVEAATRLPCLNAKQLQAGDLNARLIEGLQGLSPDHTPELALARE
jgi:hypothetical protein